MLRPTLALAVLLIAPVTADAAKVQDTFYNSVIPSRVDHLVGFAPTSFGIHPRDEPLRPLTVRVRGRTYRFLFSTASAVVAASPDIYLRNMIRQRRYPGLQGVFLDRRLTAAERRHMVVRADLGRDADVLAVASGHPACASGVSRAAARGIAKGTIRTWSAAGVPTPAGGDAIALRRAGDGLERPRRALGPALGTEGHGHVAGVTCLAASSVRGFRMPSRSRSCSALMGRAFSGATETTSRSELHAGGAVPSRVRLATQGRERAERERRTEVSVRRPLCGTVSVREAGSVVDHVKP